MKKDYRKAQMMLVDACALYGIRQEWLTSGRKTRHVSEFRQYMTKRLREETRLSWREIGLLLGNKERATLSKKKLST